MQKIKWSLTLEGEAHGLPEVIEQLRQLMQREVTEAEHHRDIDLDPSRWTPDDFRQFWRGLTVGARRNLEEIANRPEGYPLDELERALQKGISTIGPELSSVGHQMRNFPGKERPLNDDASIRRRYEMPKYLARYIQELRNSDR